MLHLNAKLKKLRPKPVKPKVKVTKFELKTVLEAPPKLVYDAYYDSFICALW